MTFLVSQDKGYAIRSDEIAAMYITYTSKMRLKDGDITTEPAHVLKVVQKGGTELCFGEFACVDKAKDALVKAAELLEGGWGCIIEEDEVSE